MQKKGTGLEKKYTTAGGGGGDEYQLWASTFHLLLFLTMNVTQSSVILFATEERTLPSMDSVLAGI